MGLSRPSEHRCGHDVLERQTLNVGAAAAAQPPPLAAAAAAQPPPPAACPAEEAAPDPQPSPSTATAALAPPSAAALPASATPAPKVCGAHLPSASTAAAADRRRTGMSSAECILSSIQSIP